MYIQILSRVGLAMDFHRRRAHHDCTGGDIEIPDRRLASDCKVSQSGGARFATSSAP